MMTTILMWGLVGIVALQLIVSFRLHQRAAFLKLIMGLLSMFAEKNPVKSSAMDLSLVFSMGRIILFGMAVAAFRLIWRATNLGWPDAIFGAFVVISPALLAALSKVSPHEALEFGKALVARFGIGAVRGDTPGDHETMIDRSEPEPTK